MSYPKLPDEIRLSHSGGNLFNSCPRKFEFLKVYQEPRRESGFAAEVGTAMHAAVADYVTHGNKDRALFTLMQHWPIMLELEEDKETRPIEAAVVTLDSIFAFFDTGRYELVYVRSVNGEEIPGTEIAFKLNLTQLTTTVQGKQVKFSYAGVIDLILWDTLEQVYTVVDLKTTTKKLRDFSPTYRFDEQCTPYSIVIEHVLGRPIDNMRVIYLVAKIDLFSPEVIDTDFIRSKDDAREWYLGVTDRVNRISAYMNAGWFPREASSCVSWGRVCQFMLECELRDHTAISELLSQYAIGAVEDNFKPMIELDLE